jgi:NACalpha-BTF3-like transcription factor
MKAADTSKIAQAMTALAAQLAASQEAQRQRDRELAAVKVAQEDIELIVAEFELDKKAAERRLRENRGDAKATIEALLRV